MTKLCHDHNFHHTLFLVIIIAELSVQYGLIGLILKINGRHRCEQCLNILNQNMSVRALVVTAQITAKRLTISSSASSMSSPAPAAL
jgi:hypothetical protein